MPTPVAHSLAGLGFLADESWPRPRWVGALLAITVANLPDVDFLLGYLTGQPASLHWGFTHSFAAALVVAIVGGLALSRRTNVRHSAAIVFATYTSHLLLDMLLGHPRNTDFGLQLFWPLSHEQFMLPWQVFRSYPTALIHEDPIAALFDWQVLPLIARELALLVPAIGMVWIGKYALERRGR